VPQTLLGKKPPRGGRGGECSGFSGWNKSRGGKKKDIEGGGENLTLAYGGEPFDEEKEGGGTGK